MSLYMAPACGGARSCAPLSFDETPHKLQLEQNQNQNQNNLYSTHVVVVQTKYDRTV